MRHNRLTVVCPGCHFEEKTFKRVSDLKFHYQKCHPEGSLPDETYTKANGFWLALYPEDFLKVIKPTKRNSEMTRATRAAITTMLGASVCRRTKCKNDWYDEWEKEREGYKPATRKVNVEPPQYSPTPLQRSVRDPDHTIKSAVSAVKPPAPEPVKALLLRSFTPASVGAKSRSPSPAASDSTELSSFVSKSPPFRPDYNDTEVADEYNSVELRVTSINLLPEDCKVFLKEGDLTYKVLISGKVFSCPKSMQALARRMSTLNLEIQDPTTDARFTPCHDKVKREQVNAVLGIDQKLVVSIMVTAPLFEPPSKRSRMSELSAMTTSQRAGVFPCTSLHDENGEKTGRRNYRRETSA